MGELGSYATLPGYRGTLHDTGFHGTGNGVTLMGADSNRMLQSTGAARSAEGVDKSIGTAEHRRLVHALTTLRRRAGLTQSQLADRLDERQGFVSAYETGQRRLDIIELRQIAAAIGPPAAAVVAQLDALDALLDALDDLTAG